MTLGGRVNLVTSTRIAAAAALAGVAVTAVVAARSESPPTAAPAPALQTIALTGGFSTVALARQAGPPPVLERTTAPFALLGATWTNPRQDLDATVEVRTRSLADGSWTAWKPLDVDEPTAAEPTDPGRGGTDPVWVGDSDGVQARIAGAAPGTALPAGLRLDLINPDSGEPVLQQVAQTESLPESLPEKPGRGRVGYVPRPVPQIVTRAAWGADESIVKEAPEYTDDVQVLFVHHTADSNGYSCSDSARIVRGIEAYHVRSKGWNDIGYNFLVDKCGKLYEGRRGGETRPVLGAHTLGFNGHSAAIAVIGNYDAVPVSATVKNVIAQVAAYKLGMYGSLATGTATLISSGSDRYASGRAVTLNRISGHRDTGRTECPGNTLYAQLPSIRAIAAAAPARFGLTQLTGAVRVGSTYYTRGSVRPLWSTSTPSGLMNRFDVFVDGRLAVSAPRSNRTTPLDLGPGRHVLTVRAVHLSGRIATSTVSVYSDPTAPSFTSYPSARLRTGSMLSSVPVRLQWSAADRGGLRSVSLTRPSVITLGTATHTWAGTIRPGRPVTWTVQAADRAGNTRSASTTRTAVLLSETGARRTGNWGTLSNSAFLGGSALRATAAGAGLSWTFTGTSASLAVSRTASSGRVKVYVDGAYSGVLDLRSTRTLNRQAVWARAWSGSGQHTVAVVAEGSTGRPGVILDGLTYLK